MASPKLTLNRETLRRLDPKRASDVQGAFLSLFNCGPQTKAFTGCEYCPVSINQDPDPGSAQLANCRPSIYAC